MLLEDGHLDGYFFTSALSTVMKVAALLISYQGWITGEREYRMNISLPSKQ